MYPRPPVQYFLNIMRTASNHDDQIGNTTDGVIDQRNFEAREPRRRWRIPKRGEVARAASGKSGAQEFQFSRVTSTNVEADEKVTVEYYRSPRVLHFCRLWLTFIDIGGPGSLIKRVQAENKR